jgi:hypothetical protein
VRKRLGRGPSAPEEGVQAWLDLAEEHGPEIFTKTVRELIAARRDDKGEGLDEQEALEQHSAPNSTLARKTSPGLRSSREGRRQGRKGQAQARRRPKMARIDY